MPRPKKAKGKKGKKKRASRGIRVTVWFPPVVLEALDQETVEQGCSRSWLITEAVCDYLGLPEEAISDMRGYPIPKRLADRQGVWTPVKNKERKK